MAKHFLSRGRKAFGAVGALMAAALLVTSCKDVDSEKSDKAGQDEKRVPVAGGPGDGAHQGPFDPAFGGPIGPVPVAPPVWDVIQLMVRTDPVNPQNERFLDDWRFEIHTIDDQGRPTSPTYFGEVGPDGNALMGLPYYMYELPMVIRAYNEAFPLSHEFNEFENAERSEHRDSYGECKEFEIFVPAFCYNRAPWLLGPFEDALWDYYQKASRHRGEAWDASQVDCGTWLVNMQNLIMTDDVYQELHDLTHRADKRFSRDVLEDAIQENQHLLTPTRPPICMAERRHDGGGMERGRPIDPEDNPYIIRGENHDDPEDGRDLDEWVVGNSHKPIAIDLESGIVTSICRAPTLWTDQYLEVNHVTFDPSRQFRLLDRDFRGEISEQSDVVHGMNVNVYNVQLGNGREFDSPAYDDACALTSIIEFINKDDDEQDIHTHSGVTFSDLFGPDGTSVYLTSDGDAVVSSDDTWAIFYRTRSIKGEEEVLAVELLGIRRGDWRDALHMIYEPDSEDLFLGLAADFELNEEEVDGERAFLAYTISVWDGSDQRGREQIREDIANCYEASDVWAREFFVTQRFQRNNEDDCGDDEECRIRHLIRPLEAAEFAVRSQCFSNSRSNQRWRTIDTGYWSINADHGVTGNVVINPGWLAPHMNFQLYVQKFDEAVFKGPRLVVTTDEVGQLMADVATLVEGDRVLLKSQDACCDDYDLVLPCVPEFTGFAGAPGVPYVPVTLGPIPVPPIAPGGPLGPIGPGGPGPVGPGGPGGIPGGPAAAPIK